MSMGPLALAVVLGAGGLFPVHGATAPSWDTEPGSSSAAPPTSVRDRLHELGITGFVDTYYAWNFNRPADHANFTAHTGTSGKRADEFSLNLAGLDFVYSPEPVGVHLTFVAGSGTDILHQGEPTGPGVSPATWRPVYLAFVSLKVPGVSALVLDLGVFPCHVGFETFLAKDNWNFTRSWLADFSPYYSAGVRATYALSSAWSAQLHILNGWQTISDVNEAKTLGARIAYDSKSLTASLNTLSGPELENDNTHWRNYGDFVLVLRPALWLNLGANADIAYERLPASQSALWYGAEGYVRVIPVETWAVTARGGYFSDPDNGISGAAQSLIESTVTVEYRPVEPLILRVEGRYDRSTQAVFTGPARADGTLTLKNNQSLLLASAVASF